MFDGVYVVGRAKRTRLLRGLLAVSTVAAAFLAPTVASGATTTWQTPLEVPNTATLNVFGNGATTAVSCSSSGQCAAAGYYLDGSDNQQVFVANEVDGVWQSAEAVPGTVYTVSQPGLNVNGYAQVSSLSCASAGFCSVGGIYTDSFGDQQVFVANEVGGVWQNAEAIPGTANINGLNVNGYAQVNSLSCASTGFCSVGGFYIDGSHDQQAFVANEVNGVWQNAIEVPGTSALNFGGRAQVWDLSCASAGVCAVVGSYENSSHQTQVFVANETNGVWGAATHVTGIPGGIDPVIARYLAIACVVGGCVITGNFIDVNFNYQPFSVLEVNGVFSTPVEVPVTAALNPYGQSQAMVLSCSADGYCVLGGSYGFGGDPDAFVVNGQLSFAAPPSNLVVNESPGSLVATWTGGAGATSYTCTLLYDFVEPSTFTEVVLTPSCAFYGLNPAADYGVSVVANVGSSESTPLVGYAVYPKYAAGTSGSRPAITTIICVRGVQVREVRGRNPRCPAGYRKVG